MIISGIILKEDQISFSDEEVSWNLLLHFKLVIYDCKKVRLATVSLLTFHDTTDQSTQSFPTI